MGGSHITPYIPIPYVETNVFRSCLFCFDSHVSDFSFLVEAPGQSMGHRMVECASLPLSLSLYWTFRARPGKQWSFTGALSNQSPQVIHLGYVAAWNQLPRDGGGVTPTAGRRWNCFILLYAMDLYVPDPIGIIFWMESTDGGTD